MKEKCYVVLNKENKIIAIFTSLRQALNECPEIIGTEIFQIPVNELNPEIVSMAKVEA